MPNGGTLSFERGSAPSFAIILGVGSCFFHARQNGANARGRQCKAIYKSIVFGAFELLRLSCLLGALCACKLKRNI